jgi:hypothetical protein
MKQFNNICVVGNKLKSFSNNKSVFTLDEFMCLLKLESKICDGKNYYNVHVGQGLNDDCLATIFSTVKKEHLNTRFIFSGVTEKTQRASLEATHKHDSKNIMISKPLKLEERFFESYLMLDENCAEMSDHITGQHIQGMVMIEAARQMINSFTEDYLLEAEQKKNASYVLKGVNTKFHQYIFPLELKMVCELTKFRRVPNGDFNAIAKISALQHGELAMEIELDYSVINKKYIEDKENNLALNSLRKIFDIFVPEAEKEFVPLAA